jgi:hypothetical protein
LVDFMAKFSWREFVADRLTALPPEELMRIGKELGLIEAQDQVEIVAELLVAPEPKIAVRRRDIRAWPDALHTSKARATLSTSVWVEGQLCQSSTRESSVGPWPHSVPR